MSEPIKIRVIKNEQYSLETITTHWGDAKIITSDILLTTDCVINEWPSYVNKPTIVIGKHGFKFRFLETRTYRDYKQNPTIPDHPPISWHELVKPQTKLE